MAEEPRERAESSATAPSPDSGGEDHQLRRRRRGLLRMYYGVENEQSKEQDNPVDIDKAGFQPPVFMEKILKECSLNELYKKEERMKREIQELDSNMQYLVYENHSKFIKASETIREMKDDFQRLEDDMTHLGSRMEVPSFFFSLFFPFFSSFLSPPSHTDLVLGIGDIFPSPVEYYQSGICN
jgi:hypothetical protein